MRGDNPSWHSGVHCSWSIEMGLCYISEEAESSSRKQKQPRSCSPSRWFEGSASCPLFPKTIASEGSSVCALMGTFYRQTITGETNRRNLGWRKSLTVNSSMQWSCRGPMLGFQHPCQAAHNCLDPKPVASLSICIHVHITPTPDAHAYT